MPRTLSTPNLRYIVNDEEGHPRRFTKIDEAVAAAAKQAFYSEKTTSILVYIRDATDDDNPLSVVYVKLRLESWK